MLIKIGKTNLNVGWKTYIAYCSNIIQDKIKSRFEINELIINNKPDPAYFISKYLGHKHSNEVYQFLTKPRYGKVKNGFISKEFISVVSLGMLCHYASRTSTVPNYLTILEFKTIEQWLFGLLEELIQYPIEDKICDEYLSIIDGPLSSYIFFSKFYDNKIPNEDIVEEFYNTNYEEDKEYLLNSVDECGILIRINEKEFTWSDLKVKEKLKKLNYRMQIWSQVNKALRNI